MSPVGDLDWRKVVDAGSGPIVYRPKRVLDIAAVAAGNSIAEASANLAGRCGRLAHPMDPGCFSSAEEYEAYTNLAQYILSRICKMCGAELEVRERSGVVSNAYQSTVVHACHHCGWWGAGEASVVLGFSDSDGASGLPWYGTLYEGCLEVFDIDSVTVPVRALADYIARNPDTLYSTASRGFERLVASVFSDHFSCEAILTGQSHDGGVDVILVRGEQTRQLVEVKRRTRRTKTEGVRTVRELAGAMFLRDQPNGVVVSTAEKFSTEAKMAAQNYRKRGYVIDLVDVAEFLRLLELTRSTRSGEPACFELLRTGQVPDSGLLLDGCDAGQRRRLRESAVVLESPNFPHQE